MSVIFMHSSHPSKVFKKPKIFACYVCSNTFTQMSNLRKHLRNIHHVQMNLRRKGTDYMCLICSLTFSRKTNLKRHQIGIHKINEDELEYSVRFLCNTCTAAFDDQISLRTHRKNRHGDDDEKIDNPYECGECGELFQKKRNLQNHMRYRHLSETDNYQFLRNILPSVTNSVNVIWYSVLNQDQKHFKAKFTMAIRNRAELENWIHEFQSKNKITLRKRSLHRTLKSNMIYHVKYGCHHNTKPKPGSTHVSAKHTKCQASIALKLFALSTDVRNYAEVRLIHTHNHVLDSLDVLKYREPIEEVKKKFRNMFMAGMTPAQALRQHKKDLEQQYGDEYSTVIGDRGICPNKSWVYNYRGICFRSKDKQPNEVEEIHESTHQLEEEKISFACKSESFVFPNSENPADNSSDSDDAVVKEYLSNVNFPSDNINISPVRNIVHIPYTADISNVKIVNNSKVIFTTVPTLRKVNDFPLSREKSFPSTDNSLLNSNDRKEGNHDQEEFSLHAISDSAIDNTKITSVSPTDSDTITNLFNSDGVLSIENKTCSGVEDCESNLLPKEETVIVDVSFSESDLDYEVDQENFEDVFQEFDCMNEIIKEKVRSNGYLIDGMQQMINNFHQNLKDLTALNSAMCSFGNKES